VPESKIAWYTADDPNDDLLAVAIDEQKEVLIFKVAVALGFDAPRAFTLVSMRGAKDTDFGIQVVGRILRVHGRLQGPTLEQIAARAAAHGYVFLADAANQSGLVHAGEKINAIQSELSQVCPFTMVVKVAGRNEIQVTHNGQAQLLSVPYTPPAGPAGNGASGAAGAHGGRGTGLAADRDSDASGADATGSRAAIAPHAPARARCSRATNAFPLRRGAARLIALSACRCRPAIC
jgi:hypothetical protein